MMIYKTCALASSLALLSACGGSGGDNFDTVPIATAGFAAQGQTLEGDLAFTINDSTRTNGTNDGVISQEKTDTILISGNAENGPIEVVLDGVTYTLEQDAADPQSFEFEDENTFIDLTGLIASTDIGGNDDAVAVSLFAIRNNTLNSGRFVLGFDTDPATVDKLVGSAEFTGEMDAVLRNGFAASPARGDVTFTVDFDDNMVDGDGVLLGDPEDQDVQIESIAITFDPTALDENNFVGTISVPDADIAGPLADGEYNGRLFGPDGETIGGTFTGRIVLEEFEQDTFIDGVFLGVD